MIEIKNVSKTYPGGIKANDNISFTVNNGETVALVGPNGSGKTTLIRQILGVISPGEGKILIDGRYDAPDNTAYVPQMPALYPALTVREHLLVTMKYLGIPKREAGENRAYSRKNRPLRRFLTACIHPFRRTAEASFICVASCAGS